MKIPPPQGLSSSNAKIIHAICVGANCSPGVSELKRFHGVFATRVGELRNLGGM
jgi:hypothetical protein